MPFDLSNTAPYLFIGTIAAAGLVYTANAVIANALGLKSFKLLFLLFPVFIFLSSNLLIMIYWVSGNISVLLDFSWGLYLSGIILLMATI